MQEAGCEPPTSSPGSDGPSWYRRCLAYLRNHGRVDPAKVELPHCDFFIVGQRRTLRVLRPALRGRWFYEGNNGRPESVNDNFFSRWSKRPHPSGNCRCSFRQSARLSSTEEEIISKEINRIRTSLCEAEKTGQDIGEIERSVAINLDVLIPVTSQPTKRATVAEEKIVKTKIIQDLERYINDLLQEILTDSVKFAADVEKLGRREGGDDESVSVGPDERKSDNNGEPFGNLNFAFHADEQKSLERNGSVRKEEMTPSGYENPAFLGSSSDPDGLEFYLNRPVGKSLARCTMEQLDCIDSGINSVETVEFQPDQEPSLEESLMEIIDAKLGRTHLRKSWEDFQAPKAKSAGDDEPTEKVTEPQGEVESPPETGGSDTDTSEPLDEVQTDPSFAKLRLEFSKKPINEEVQLRRRADSIRSSLVAQARERSDSFGRLQEDKESNGSELDDSCSVIPESPRDIVLFRKNRKPTIVFLHGFGSSADVFELQLEYFSNLGYPCIAPDMLGHGLSSAPDRASDYHFEKLLKDLVVLLHHYAFRPGHKCVIVAHNYGCSLAAALACKFESNIHQLVLISGGGPTPLARPSAEGAAHCCLRAMVAPLLVCGLRREVMYSPRGRQHPYCGSEPPEQRPSHMKYVLDGMVWPEGEYTLYRRICTPTLLVHGLRDNEVSLVQECQMERTMVKAFLEALPSAGHNPMTDCPEQLNHMIHCFIDLWKNKKW
ncbi:uncharacterized protein LOC107223091 [Neodiprion lecontei]|uniref:acylglycerol lipase n=1 Tax=Neodiprion lecontei TaxID=441921 RepID=A0A6J0BVR9_NEOLC|nr:uncharacterized protein LOC107223091 [Neodiprion lecontei]